MGWFIALVGFVLTGVVAYQLGVRAERGRHARWEAIQEVLRAKRANRDGIVLKRLRITR